MKAAGAWLARYWLIAGIFVAWGTWVHLGEVNEILAPSPLDVLGDLLGQPGAYLPDLGWTLLVSALGLMGGMALGALLAVLVWLSPLATGLVTPTALIMRSVPVVALIPVIGRMVGFGQAAISVVTIVVCFFPAFVFTHSGLRSVPRTMLDVFAVLDASVLHRLRLLHLPHALSRLLVALRLTAPNAVLAAMLGEYLLGQHGLGRLFADSVTYMDTSRAWGTALIAATLSVSFFAAARRIERIGIARLT